MAQVVYSAQARADIEDIWVRVATNGGEALASDIVARIERRVAMLTRHPLIGPERPEIGVEARSLLIERWLVLYRVADPLVQIMRIVDGARDLRSIPLAGET